VLAPGKRPNTPAHAGTLTEARTMEYTRKHYDFGRKDAAYGELARDLTALLAGESDLIANAANTAALIFDALPDINWAGFYFLRGGELVVGPFQGKPACVRIPMGRGVCGAAAAQRKPIIVADVHAFPGHIACDSASRSEIVIPIAAGEAVLGVLDIDSPTLERFEEADLRGLTRLVEIFRTSTRFQSKA
jgi:L-methionine (R)-S-oxide reductase